MGRPWPLPGEPLFLREDTDAVLALAAEEADTCPSCGMPRAFCRSGASGVTFADFEPLEETCQATLRLEQHREAVGKKRDTATNQATQMSVRFREGRGPGLFAGLDLGAEDGGEDGEQHEGQ